MLRQVVSTSFFLLMTFSAHAQGVLDRVYGRWAIATTANCSNAHYDWSVNPVTGTDVIFRDAQGKQNREHIDTVSGSGFTSTTVESSDTPIGAHWSYTTRDQNSFQVRNASNRREFRLVRCPAPYTGASRPGPEAVVGSLRPSRNAEPGCRWTPFTAAQFGLRLLVQDCSSPGSRYVFSVKGDWIEMHRPADNRTFGSHQIIRLLTKPDGLTIEEAIRRFAANTFPGEARDACVVRTAPHAPPGPAGRSYFTLLPTAAYARKIEADLKEGPRDFGCGPDGGGQRNAYFEYHPAESTAKFLFVDAGQDAPLFDEGSLQFEPP